VSTAPTFKIDTPQAGADCCPKNLLTQAHFLQLAKQVALKHPNTRGNKKSPARMAGLYIESYRVDASGYAGGGSSPCAGR
jgi:hypothetical protein